MTTTVNAAREICRRYETLKSRRSNWEWLWDECIKHCLPEEQLASYRRWYGEETEKPYDVTGIRANQLLSSMLFSHTVSMGREWFTFRARNKAAQASDRAKRWMSEAGRLTLEHLQDSNFAVATQEMLTKLPALGTGCAFAGADGHGGLFFRDYSIVDVCVAESPTREVNTVYRAFEFTAQQAVEEWGAANVHEKVREAFARDPYATFRFVHAVFPAEMDPAKGAHTALPLASYYIDRDNEHVCHAGGFQMQPYAVPRWSLVSGECYGRGPAMMALMAMRMLSRATVDYIDGVEMATFPPVFVSHEDAQAIRRIRPAEIIPIDVNRPPIQYQSAARIDAFVDFLHRHQSAVEELFFVSMLLAAQNPMMGRANMTATEVEQRAMEGIQAISPVVNRLQREYFSPIVTRSLGLLLESGAIPPPPRELVVETANGGAALPVDVVYTTQLDARLAQTRVNNLMNALGQIAQVSVALQQAPDAGMHVRTGDVYREVLRANNTNESVIRSEAEVRKMVEQMQAQQAQAQAAAMQAQAAQKMVRPVDVMKRPEEGSVAGALMAGG